MSWIDSRWRVALGGLVVAAGVWRCQKLGDSHPPAAPVSRPAAATVDFSYVRNGLDLYDGPRLFGRVVMTDPAHTFENGVTEPGVLIDTTAGATIWMPLRSVWSYATRPR